MLRMLLALCLSLFALDAKAQSNAPTDPWVTRTVTVVTSYCGTVRADWAAFQPYLEEFSAREVQPNEGELRRVEFEPLGGVEIDLSDMGAGRLRCGTGDIRLDATGYVSAIFALMREFPEYFGGDREGWIWPVSPSSPDGRRGWRWVTVTRTPIANSAVIMIAYYNYTPEEI
jgi:hypothetical protein